MRDVAPKTVRVDHYFGVGSGRVLSFRPGVAKSGMMRGNTFCDSSNMPREKLTQILFWRSLMKRDFWVMACIKKIVIKVAHQFCGVNTLRSRYAQKGNVWKVSLTRRVFRKKKNQFYCPICTAKGFPSTTIMRCGCRWRVCGYAFSKGHSASYAVESFQSLLFEGRIFHMSLLRSNQLISVDFFARSLFSEARDKERLFMALVSIKATYLTVATMRKHLHGDFIHMTDFEEL